METKWTKDQQEAIYTRDCNLLVAAAAGSGKTAVLVERIIQRILDADRPVDIDKLLVVTFTNAAASEMRERIGEALSKELDKYPDSVRLQEQIALIPRSSIMTMHSFCLNVIKNNFHNIDIDPGFRIGDETETLLLKQEALEELFEEKYELQEEAFTDLIESYSSGKDDIKLKELVLRIHSFSESTPFPGEWLRSASENFNISADFDFNSSVWAKYMVLSIKSELIAFADSMGRAYDIICELPELEVYKQNFEAEKNAIEALLPLEDYEQLTEGLAAFSFDKLKPCKSKSDEKTKVTDIRNAVKKSMQKINADILKLDPTSIAHEIKSTYPLMDALSNLTEEFSEGYRLKKKDRGIIDFNDIEHLCLSILTERDDDGNVKPSQEALELREKFEEVLVDEYQDTNHVQELLLRMVSKTEEDVPNLFMVGDIKQSIYRFRHAKPELFINKYLSFPQDTTGRNKLIKLSKNFRSRGEVLEGVNFIFNQIMSREAGELEYNEEERLYTGAEFEDAEEDYASGGPVELHIIEKNSQSEEADEDLTEDEEEELDSIQVEGRFISRRIAELMDSNFMVWDKSIKSYRRLQYKDFVILLRATREWAPVIAGELELMGIPVYTDAGMGYFDTVEIKTVTALLNIIDNPDQDIPLLSVLRSPMFMFTAEELIDIRLEEGEESLYKALIKASESQNEALAIKINEFLYKLGDWRKRAQYMPVDELIWMLYSQTGYYSYAGAMPGGMQRQANLRMLFERAKAFEGTSLKGLFSFINFLGRLKTSSGDLGSAKILSENENVVRIMSIHKSKGLEFPVVILAGTGKKFNMRDLSENILLHSDMGFGPDIVDFRRRIYYPGIIKEAIKRKIRLENISEEMRILYVALTRAKEKLIITGSVSDMQKALGKWIGISEASGRTLSPYEVTKCRSFLDWIGSALARHEAGIKLYEKAGINYELARREESISAWEIHPWSRERALELEGRDNIETDSEAIIKELEEAPKTIHSERIIKALGYTYPFEKASSLPGKVTVTELKRIRNKEILDDDTESLYRESEFKKPKFMEESTGITGARRGTLMHLAMQVISSERADTLKDLREQLEDLVDRNFVTADEAECINLYKIRDFYKSGLGIRLKNAVKVKREVPFYFEVPASEVYELSKEDKTSLEPVIIQGVIDCFFEEEDGLVIIDYKTDYVTPETVMEVKERYRVQLDYYRRALERVTGKKVKECYIYLFGTGESLRY